MGHSLNLMHTHEPCCTNQDECADTITDNASWTKDQVAQNNFGNTYNNLTAGQKNQVDLVYNNVMSYHVDEPQLRLSYCQMGRCSATGYDDRTWLLSKNPIHVNRYVTGILCTLFSNGSFAFPFCDLQSALTAGGLNNGVLVLEQGAYTMTQETINANVEIVTRAGGSTISRGVELWDRPVDLDNSSNPDVRRAIKAAQDDDTAVRAIERQAKERAEKVTAGPEKSAIMDEAQQQAAPLREKAVLMLQEAEKYAVGDERLAIQLELAQRYQQAERFDLAIKYFSLVADATDQTKLRDYARLKAEECRKLASQKTVQPETSTGAMQ
jgi:hypothetical protein